MALNFPTTASAGDYYQSGSSDLYQFNGSYWKTVTGSVVKFELVLTASQANSHMRDITYVSTTGYSNMLMVADGRIFSHAAGSSAYTGYTTGIFSSSAAAPGILPGADNIYEIVIPGETGSAVEVNQYGYSAYALYDNGNLYTWGLNGYGQLGQGHTNYCGLPALSSTNVTKVWWDPSMMQGDVNYSFLVIQKDDGYCYAAGYNGQGQLGVGDTTSRSTWTKLTDIGTNPRYVGAWGTYVGGQIVQKSNGQVIVCGWNGYGELGLGTTVQWSNFVPNNIWTGYNTNMTIQGVYAKNRYADPSAQNFNAVLVWMTDGVTDRLVGSGGNAYYAIGDGTNTQRYYPTATTLPSGKRIQKIVNTGNYVGAYHILFTDGTVYGWGRNNESQIGNGNTTNQTTPTLIMSGALDIYQVGANSNYYTNPGPIVKKADGYYTWGKNDYGTVGDGTYTVRSSPVKMRLPQGVNIKFFTGLAPNDDRYAKVAITDDNRYFSWGHNGYYTVNAQYSDNIATPTEYVSRALIR